jgi:CBS domain containing-hemolysin-like protein
MGRLVCGRPGSRAASGRTHAVDTAIGLGAVLFLIAVTAFFVAAEFALVASDRSRVDQDAEAGRGSARATRAALRRLTFHLSGTQLGVTAASIVLGFLAEPAIAQAIEAPLGDLFPGRSVRGLSLAIGFALATLGSVVLGELIPKNVAIAKPVPVAYALIRPLRFYTLVFGPLIRLLTRAANWCVRRLHVEPQEELASVRSLEELELLIRSSGEEGTLDPDAFDLLTRTLRFNSKTAADALIPRLDVVAVRADDTVAEVIALSHRTGFSRFPVIGADLDDTVGVVHVKDALRLPVEGRAAALAGTIMDEPFVAPESRDLTSLLQDLRQVGVHLAVVVDEFGGTAGIITLEDVVEEIVGDIADEYDPADASLTRLRPAGSFEVDGSAHLGDVLDDTGLELPDGEYETVAGFVLDQLGRIPAIGDTVEHEGWTLRVLAMDRNRIARVLLTAPAGRDDGAGERASGAAP